MKKDDLRVDRVHVIEDLGPTLLLEVTSRRGVRGFYHLAFKSMGQLQEDNLLALPVGQGSDFLGAGVAKGKAVFLIKTIDRGKPVVQVRDLTTNGVISTHPIDAKGPWELGSWSMDKGVLRALVREAKDDESIDDQAYLQFEWSTEVADGTPLRAEPALQVIGQASLFTDSSGQAVIIWLDRGTSDKVRSEPKHKMIRWRAGKEPATEVDDKGKIESWAFLEGYDHALLALIKGDTLLWENSAIEINRLSKVSPFSRENAQNLPLSRVHVAQPLLLGGPKAAYMLLPQWLDHELTMGVYELQGSELEVKGYAGVFREGTSFYRAFYHEPSKDYFVLTSTKTSGAFLGRYVLCQVDL
ncbi:MAG: hypothetical protein ACOVS5_09155 [Oligoflexus sp.]|jgi:hypothetical protein